MEFFDGKSPLWTETNGCGLLSPSPDVIAGCDGEVLSRQRRMIGGSPSAVGTALKDGRVNDGIECGRDRVLSILRKMVHFWANIQIKRLIEKPFH